MSKNPAWHSYNETVRKINEEYEKTVKPLRVTLSTEIAETEARINPKIEALQAEKRTIIDGLKDTFSDKVVAAEKKRREAMTTAVNVRNAEIAASREKEALPTSL